MTNILEMLDTDSIIRSSQVVSNNHIISLDEPISEPRKYRDIIHCLITASEGDFINILINSEGGRLDTALAIIEAMNSCPATLMTTVVGSCYSAASMIACMSPSCVITDSAEFMIHTASYGSGGTVPNVRAHTEFTTAQIDKLINKVYTGFLTAKEIDEVKKGREYWFTADDARDRMDRRSDVISKQREAQLRKQTAELKKALKEIKQ